MVISEHVKKGGFLKGDRFAMSVVLAGNNEDQLVGELREAKEALLDWFRQRGERADLVLFMVMSPAMHAAAEATLRDIVEQEKDLCAPLQRRTVKVDLVGLGGKSSKEITWSQGRWRA